MAPAYKRILLKVSGEALAGDNSFGIEPPFLQAVAKQIADVANSGVEIAIVVGGGNIFRGMAGAADGTDRVTADLMGMLGTMINALALSNAISRQGAKAKPYSAVSMPSVADRAARGWKKRQRVARTSSRSSETSTSYSLTSVCGSEPRMSVWT